MLFFLIIINIYIYFFKSNSVRFKHPKYRDHGSFPNDVALLKLADPVDFKDGIIRDICLPEPGEDIRDEGDRSSELGCWLAGWGVTQSKQQSLELLYLTYSSLLVTLDIMFLIVSNFYYYSYLAGVSTTKMVYNLSHYLDTAD